MFLYCSVSFSVESSEIICRGERWRVSSSDMVTDPSKRVSDIGTGCLEKPVLQVLDIFQGVFLVLSVQNFLQEYYWYCRSSASYRSSRTIKRALEISLKSEFLHLVTLSLKALTCFLRTLSFVDHYGT